MDSIQDLFNILKEDPVYYVKRQSIMLLSDTLKVFIYSEKAAAVSATISWRQRRFHYSYERIYSIFPGNNALCFCFHVRSTGTSPQRRASRRIDYSIRLTVIRDALTLYLNEYLPDAIGFMEPPINLFICRIPTPESFDYRVECLYICDIPLRERHSPCRLQDFCTRTIALIGLTADYIAENIGRAIVDPNMLALNELQKLVLDCRFLERMNFSHGGEICFTLLRSIGHVRPAIHNDSPKDREDAFWRLTFSEEYKELLMPFMSVLLSRNNLVLNVFGSLLLNYFDDEYDYYSTSSIPDNLCRVYQIETFDDDYDSPYSNNSSDDI